MKNLIFDLVKAVVCLMVGAAVIYVVPWLKTHISAEKLNIAMMIVEAAVRAAQQTMSDAPGQARKAEVTHKVLSALREHGISLTVEQLDDLIESAVKTMKIQEGRL